MEKLPSNETIYWGKFFAKLNEIIDWINEQEKRKEEARKVLCQHEWMPFFGGRTAPEFHRCAKCGKEKE